MGWIPNIKVPNQASKASPALAAFDGKLYMVHLGDSSNDIWYSSFDGNSWTTNEKVPNQASKASPALATFDGNLYMVHLGDSSNDIWYSKNDPAYEPPMCTISAEPPQRVGNSIVGVGRRDCQGTDPPPALVTVRLRKYNFFWFDKTLASKSEFGVNVELPATYECRGRGSQTVYTEIIEERGEKKQSPRIAFGLCS